MGVIESDNPPTTPVLTRTDKQIDFNWLDGAPSADLEDDDFGVRWTGFLVPPVSGKYAIGGKGFNAFDIYLDEEKIVSFNNIHHPSYKYKEIDLVAGQSYELKVEFFETLNDSSMQLLWSVPGRREKQAQEAIEVARKADVVIMAMGLSPRLEGEEMKVPVEGFKGGDRLTLRLPKIQRELIRKVARLGKPVVLVLFNGSAVAVNWEAVNVPAIVEAWYSGEAAGKAISDILFGDYNPGGRLPVTFYSSVNQLPPFEDYGMDSKTYRYFEQAPLFPFGYGLSYTSFGYQDLRVPETVQAGESFSVSVEVSNLGQTAGDEVVQLYVTLSDASVPVPIRSLKGFTRIFLEPGERKVIEFELTPEDVSLIDDEARRVVEPGTIEVVVGGKQPGFKGLADASTTMVLSRDVEISGDTFLVD
jgi:beta-glucosidase